jgi:cation:H+ antiporter
MTLDILCALLGFVILYYGSSFLVEGSIRIAVGLGMSRAIVGLTLVAFGTSSPELFVNIVAAFKSETGFALTNVAGSNLVNLCIGFGLCALVCPLIVPKERFRVDLYFYLLAPMIVLAILLLHPATVLPGWSFVIFFTALFFYIRSLAGRNRNSERRERGEQRIGSGLLFFVLGSGLLYGGGEAVLHASISMSGRLDIPNTVIGLTVVAIGTSIPDIMASVVAAKRGEPAIAVGNLVGSNIYNILFVLGGTLMVSGADLFAETWIVIDYGMVCLSTAFFFLFVKIDGAVSRLKGVFLIVIFAAYMTTRLACL